jgi:hypothetical protein
VAGRDRHRRGRRHGGDERVEPHRLVLVGVGARGVAQLAVEAAAVEVGDGKLRVETDGLAQVGDRALAVVLCAIRVAAGQVGDRETWIDPDRLREVGDGAVEIARGRVGATAVAVMSAMARSKSPLTP